MWHKMCIGSNMNPLIPTQGGGNGTSSRDATTVRGFFRRFAACVSAAVGSPWAFLLAAGTVVVWAALGPHYGYSDTWQLIINTGTTIVTFLMVFLIQNSQNRDARAIHLKLDELLRAVKGARTGLVDLEELSDEELDRLQQQFKRLKEREMRKKSRDNHEEPAVAAHD
jgi:low affinity Fe/Cu permease